MTIGTLIIFLLVLAALIFVHELGHFIAARACGIRVDSFKLGFGPKVFAWRPKAKNGSPGETEYGINWIPFGGYVKIHGEDPDQESISGVDAARSFVNKPRWQQAIVLAAGVFMNFLFAWVIYVCVFSTGVAASPEDFPQYASTFKDPRILITQVLPGSPAFHAGLKGGDSITEVHVPQTGADVVKGSPDFSTTNITSAIYGSAGSPVFITYTRGKAAAVTAQVAPTSTIVAGKLAVGISMSDAVTVKLPFIAALKESVPYTYDMIISTASGLYGFIANIFRGAADFSQVSGPVGIAQDVGDASALGLSSLLLFVALISINLGVVNLIPFPALDGGRILFVVIEGIIRRRIPAGFTNWVNAIGFALLMTLMIAVTWKDIAKLIAG